MSGDNPYFANGHLDPDLLHYDRLYVRRRLQGITESAEHEIVNRASRRCGSFVWSARQTGKTSLLYFLNTEARRKGWASAYVSLPDAGQDEQAWYKEISGRIGQGVMLHCQRLPDPATDHFHFESFMESLARNCDVTCILLLIDELDAVSSNPKIGVTFLTALRRIQDISGTSRILRRWVFILAASSPKRRFDALIPEHRSPLNNVEHYTLLDFDYDAVSRLASLAKDGGKEFSEDVIKAVYSWTEGHPYLTQRIFYRLYDLNVTQYTQEHVDAVARSLIEQGDRNLQHIRRQYDRLPERPHQLWIQNLLATEAASSLACPDPIYERLWAAGLIRKDEREAVHIRSQLYREFLLPLLATHVQEHNSGSIPEEIVASSARLRNWVVLGLPFVTGGIVWWLVRSWPVAIISTLTLYLLALLNCYYWDVERHRKLTWHPILESPRVAVGFDPVCRPGENWQIDVKVASPGWRKVRVTWGEAENVRPSEGSVVEYTFENPRTAQKGFSFEVRGGMNPAQFFLPLISLRKLPLTIEWPGHRLSVVLVAVIDHRGSLPFWIFDLLKRLFSPVAKILDTLSKFLG